MKKVYRHFKNKKLLFISRYKVLNVLWYPEIENIDDFNREISRMLWYTNPFKNKIEHIYMYCSKQLMYSIFKPPKFVDPIVSKFYTEIKHKIVLINDMQKIKKSSFDIIVLWNNTLIPKTKSVYPFIVNASIYHNQFEANQLVKLSSAFLKKDLIATQCKKLVNYLQMLKDKNFKSVNVFGSGPSLKHYKKHDFNNSISIICNSIVKNEDFLRDVQPNIMVATDAVFHSGYSQYASEFRVHLCKALDLVQEMILIVPMRDIVLYLDNLPKQYRDRIIGIQSKQLQKFNLDLLREPVVKSTSNVLTLMMLPLASTFELPIKILGFDGKSIKKEEKFWDYDSSSQFASSMDSTRLAHPAFYAVDYEEYYETHCEEVRKIMQLIEEKSLVIKMLAHSYISALNKYYD